MKDRLIHRMIVFSFWLNVASCATCAGLWLTYGATQELVILTGITLLTGTACAQFIRSTHRQARQRTIDIF